MYKEVLPQANKFNRKGCEGRNGFGKSESWMKTRMLM
jgi:hypothetical protein